MSDKTKEAKEVNIRTSPKNYNKFWKQGMEKISSSMSLIHNGHYIAATFSAFLSTLTAHLASIPWEIGYTLARWQKSLNVAIKKTWNPNLRKATNYTPS